MVKLFMSGRRDTVELYDWKSGKKLRISPTTQARHSFAFAVSADGKMLAINSDETAWHPVIHIKEIATGGERIALSGQSGSLRRCEFSADGKRLISVTSTVSSQSKAKGREATEGSLCVWDLTTGKMLHEISMDSYGFANVARL